MAAVPRHEKNSDALHLGKDNASSGELDRSSEFENDAGGVDAGDMYRMGKEQQFKVSYPAILYHDLMLMNASASFVSLP